MLFFIPIYYIYLAPVDVSYFKWFLMSAISKNKNKKEIKRRVMLYVRIISLFYPPKCDVTLKVIIEFVMDHNVQHEMSVTFIHPIDI
jgi:hypothetical protein